MTAKPLNKSNGLERLIAEAATKVISSRIIGKVQKDPEKRALMGVHYYSTNTPEEQADLIVRMVRPKLHRALASQPKPDIKWPEKKKPQYYKGHPRTSVDYQYIGYNAGIDACIEAVELAMGGQDAKTDNQG